MVNKNYNGMGRYIPISVENWGPQKEIWIIISQFLWLRGSFISTIFLGILIIFKKKKREGDILGDVILVSALCGLFIPIIRL